MKNAVVLFALLLLCSSAYAGRSVLSLNDNWKFRFSHQVQFKSEHRVDLPHTWNATDALSGKQDYLRTTGNYEKSLFIRPEWKGKRIYLRFEGVNTVTSLLVNDRHVGEHRGGYGAFVFDITDFITYNQDNKLLVKVSNALTQDVMPLVGDFNIYGGIYRDVNLIVADPVSISLTDYASPGVYLQQQKVSRLQADIRAKVMLSNHSAEAVPAEVKINVWDGERLVLTESLKTNLAVGENQAVTVPFTISNPRLWNGRTDPFMYKAEVVLVAGGIETDKVVQPLGVRYYRVDSNNGFFLNDNYLKLQGVCRHQDRAERGSALTREHHDEDAAIMMEMGANAVRLAHYPQASYFYDLMDKGGIIVWAEIPFIGPGGYQDRGFINLPSFKANGIEQLRELIRQHYNHPSICFWGLFNELKTLGDSPVPYIQELNEIAHAEDPTLPTTSASFLEDGNEINKITDLIAWNKYYGWYGGSAADLAKWADQIHRNYPSYKIGVSEYGAGASIYHQQDSLKPGDPSGWWHPENWQTNYHMENWKAISERPFIWGSFIWNLFDFGAAHRTEGDRPGINDKGLVTFDRKVKKDAFYFYKANWNKKDKFIYIANRRCVDREEETDILVFANIREAELLVNGQSMGKQVTDKQATICWKNVKLRKGANVIEVRSTNRKDTLSDKVTFISKHL
ncbi:MAG: glycoside hydrolase family 2 TIM barrel-domain containing protein [Macellibacteroides fermentans]|uniref:beta-glucuronidase LacZ4 n=1 Tax=Macellibacteroides fermentans TaxID=879969 RepID=UPI003AD2F939